VTYSDTDRTSYYGAGMDPNAWGESSTDLWITEGQVNYSVNDDHTISTGVQYKTEQLNDSQPAYNRTIDQEVDDTGVFAQHEWDLTEDLNIVYGLRADFNSEVDDAILSPRFGVRYEPVDNVTLRGSYSTGFRPPQVFDEDLHIAVSNGEAQIIRNASGLKEETSQSFSVGAQWQPTERSFLSGDLFYTAIEDTFFLDEDDDPMTPETEFTRINQGESQVYGAEVNTGYQWENLRLEVGYGVVQAEFDDPEPDFNQKDFFRTAEDYGVVKLTLDTELAKFFIGGKYTGQMKVPLLVGEPEQELRTSDRFFTVDLGLTKDVELDNDTTLTFQAGVKNVFDEYQDDLQRGADRDVAYTYGPRFPRTWYTSVAWKF
jgi:outer membrane receptor for ferrienterochelin and colicins